MLSTTLRLPPALAALLVWATPDHAQTGFRGCVNTIHTLSGEATGDQFGWVSSPIADVTGDGVMELFVGAPFHDTGGANAGRVYLYDGRLGTVIFTSDGGAAGARLGYSLRDAGDLDGDGLGDLIAGSPGSPTVPGTARVISSVTGLTLLTVTGGAGDNFGYSTTGVGDVNGDGVEDVAVGAITEDTAGSNAGRVDVFSGADGAVLLSFFGESGGDNFGSSLGKLGDVTGDGFPELAVGAHNATVSSRGKAYVFDLLADALVYSVLPETTGSNFGQFFIASAGLINGDQVPDLYVSDFGDNFGRGKAYLFDGPTGALIYTVAGAVSAGFGIGRPIGDVDGDGRDDLVMGAWSASLGASQSGYAEILSGATGMRRYRIVSTRGGENFGFDAHGLGDVDGDGVPDAVVTAASFNNNRGRVYVLADRPLEPFGQGVAGTGGLEPTLAFGGCPRPGEAITIDTADALPDAAGVLFVGLSRIDVNLFGGTIYPDLTFLSAFHAADAGGAASLPFTVATDPGLIGAELYAQALYVDPGAPAGLSFTQGLRMTLY